MEGIKMETYKLTEEQIKTLTQSAKTGHLWADEGLSNCCGASIIHTDMCSDCLEHCDVLSELEYYGEENAE
jgi:hypothetical protein